jgi:hypothetical protein
MHGDTATHPISVVDELLNAVRAADGGLDEQEIAEILDPPELGVSVQVTRERAKTTTANDRD